MPKRKSPQAETSSRAYDVAKVADRLKELRESKGWTLVDMSKELDKKIGVFNDESKHKLLILGADGGRSIIKDLETDRTVTIGIASAYADIFGVSLDYIYGLTDEWQAGSKEIEDTLGLSKKAITVLRKARKYKDIDRQDVDRRFSELCKQGMRDTKEYRELLDSYSYLKVTQALNILLEDDFQNGSLLLREIADYICYQIDDNVLHFESHKIYKGGTVGNGDDYEITDAHSILASRLVFIQRILEKIREKQQAGGGK